MDNAYKAKLIIVGVLSTVSFFILLTFTEAIPEIPVDIDFKPFFLPMSLIALVPSGCAAFAVSVGAMLGEFLRDMLEGYEIDDPIGAVGYVIGFFSSAYVIGNHPLNKVRVFIACLVAGFVHAVIEATSLCENCIVNPAVLLHIPSTHLGMDAGSDSFGIDSGGGSSHSLEMGATVLGNSHPNLPRTAHYPSRW
jgi:hypothetical protein